MTASTPTLTLSEARRRWQVAQRLCAPVASRSLADVVSAIGWIPLVSGASGYLSLFARGAIAHRTELDSAVFARKELSVVPGPRGLAWLVPAADTQLARAFAVADHASRETRVASSIALTSHDLGATREMLRRLLEAPRTTTELRATLPATVLRSLGDVGRKTGCSTIASLVLRHLWITGEVDRIPAEPRLDCERHRYRLAAMPRTVPSAADAVDHVAMRWFEAHGPATARAFSAALGIAIGRAQSALRPLTLKAVRVEGLDGDFLMRDEARPEAEPTRSLLLPMRDPWSEAMPSLAGIANSDDVRALCPKPFGAAPWVLRDGAIVGMWWWDDNARQIAWNSLRPLDDTARDDIEARSATWTSFVREELGELGIPHRRAGRGSPAWIDPSVTEL